MTERTSYAEAAIAAGQSVSGDVDLRSHELVGIEMPAVWTAASIAFKACTRDDGTGATLTETFLAVTDQAGAEIVVTAAASKFILFTSAMQDQLRGLARAKLVSGTNAAPVVQVAAAKVRLILAQRS